MGCPHCAASRGLAQRRRRQLLNYLKLLFTSKIFLPHTPHHSSVKTQTSSLNTVTLDPLLNLGFDMYWRIFTFQRSKDIAPFPYNIKAEQWRDADGSTNKQALCMHSLRALLSRRQGVVHANLLGLETTRLRRDDTLHLGHRVHNLS